VPVDNHREHRLTPLLNHRYLATLLWRDSVLGMALTSVGRSAESSIPGECVPLDGVIVASTPNDRSRGIVALIEGFFAFMWFGWGQAQAPSWLTVPLLVGSALGAFVGVVGGVVAVRATGQRTPMAEREVRARYNVIVGVEFLLIAAGAFILGAAGAATWIPVWVCAVVGLHFLPLARVFPGLLLVPLAVALVVVALVALAVGLATTTSPSTVAGPGAGVCLVVAAVATLVTASGYRNGTATGPVPPLTAS